MNLLDDINKLIHMIYELEVNNNSDRVVVNDSFQIHKLYPQSDGGLAVENDIYPIFYYRDKDGNEILINNTEDVFVKLKDKNTVKFNNIENFGEEKEYIEDTINYLKVKTLIKK